MTALIENAKWFLRTRDPFLEREKLFRMIWRDYSTPLLYFLRHYSFTDAEDLLQEVMIKVFEKLHTFKPAYSFKVWIYTIARNHALNHVKRRSVRDRNRTDSLESAGRHISDDRPDSGVMTDELAMIINGYLGELDAQQRQIAFLRFYEEFSYSDIARLLSIPEGTVKSRLHLIREELNKRLEHYHAD